MSVIPPPTQAGFVNFIRQVMGITTQQLPDNSPVIPIAYEVSLQIVNQVLQCIVPEIYTLCVYNLGGSNIINYAPDTPPSTFFADTRKAWNLLGFVSGVISASADETTSQTLVVQEAAKNFTLANLNQLQDPYGRRYLGLSQSYGPVVWGVS